MTQIFYLGGGEAKENFAGDYYDFLRSQTYDPYAEKFSNWKKFVLSEMGYFGIKIPFPDDGFADYRAWKIVFEAHLGFVKSGDIFLTMSLGGGFLLKYLQEEKTLPKKLSKIIFLAPGWKDTPDETIGAFAPNMEKFQSIESLADEIHIFHSIDDPVVPFADSETLYQKYLPYATFHTLQSGGHFFGLERFVELEGVLGG